MIITFNDETTKLDQIWQEHIGVRLYVQTKCVTTEKEQEATSTGLCFLQFF